MRLNADEDYLKCDYCKSIFFPAKDDEGVSVLQVVSEEECPVCAVPLMHAAVAKIRIRYCTRCHGMLIPMAVFLALVEELRAGEPGTLIAPTPTATTSNARSTARIAISTWILTSTTDRATSSSMIAIPAS
jgi:Zn-finger nucleic acid-binding protein